MTIECGSGWIVNGNFKLIHAIDLDYFSQSLSKITDAVDQDLAQKPIKSIIEFHLNQTRLRLDELQKQNTRKVRSINWLGSAWKWLAGSPDATDWDTVLRSQNEIIANSNQQYVINRSLFNATNEAIERVNDLITYVNSIEKGTNAGNPEILMLARALVLREQISEIVRAAQMAKAGIVNTNLLNQDEIERIILEEQVLPYSNLIEAMEYAKPSVYTNGTLLLYVLSVPKLRTDRYRWLAARATSLHGKRVNLQYRNLLVNEDETYGVANDCYSINNATICEMSSIKKLPEDGCLARLLKGGDASCQYEPHEGEIVELVDDNTIFVTNFVGAIQGSNQSKTLNGTYLIQLSNETVYIGGQVFSSRTARSPQALPPVLSNVTLEGLQPNLKYIHGLSLENISRLSKLGQIFHISTGVEIIFLSVLTIACYIIWKKLTADIHLPKVHPIAAQGGVNELPKSPPSTYVDLRDAGI